MRIISGQFKGRKLQAPKHLPVRPTTDMAKEALFNILNNTYYFDELSVLDLFAGTGNISFEFASRGTTQITAVDAHYGCIKFINQTAESFGMNIHTVKSDVFKFLTQSHGKHTIIFADPPYDFPQESFNKIPQLVFENDLLEDNGYVIVEHSKHTNLSALENFSHAKNYGGCVFSFFEK
ncbi:methyltransferase [Mangrovimonas yunxiaonensis]|uniref:Methyltransferase n=1 Tax=Mangrovimonas yunxiaonensis TaxID=1197477 RepID=A0A084THS3_9FLAO|nr:16S rRNA (guanine(966)-N(2))-methyltransferase RsmD [Mangrovimonas yunxiaonensis]KFB00259.1 methyltransferase [Mangrovimonas yunxiaonensis]MBR9758185.1 16S rRNA (guanine(966)-N(2))-methyltransferase RsmD [Algicola sp.]GGH42905.1 methyltransferase [Mangrovimonas yunxiaonensis]